MSYILRYPCLSTDIHGICRWLRSEPEQWHREVDSTNGCKDKWKNVDARESHRQWKRMKERVHHLDCSLTMGGGTTSIYQLYFKSLLFKAAYRNESTQTVPQTKAAFSVILYNVMPVNAFGHLPAVWVWVLQQHWGINKQKEDDCCLLRNEMLRLVLSACCSIFPWLLSVSFCPISLSLPPSSLLVAAKVNTMFNALNHRISQRKWRAVPWHSAGGQAWGEQERK